ncbi:hypothetical protein [Fischerella sp. PCC 9605]|nr:hypothetical protein [Fischerella sp. PCC 9605]
MSTYTSAEAIPAGNEINADRTSNGIVCLAGMAEFSYIEHYRFFLLG